MAASDAKVANLASKHQDTQCKAFQRWINFKLLHAGKDAIHDIKKDLSDGVKLSELLLVLEGSDGKVTIKGKIERDIKPGPSAYHKKIQNLKYCLDFVQEKGIKVVSISAENLCGTQAEGIPDVMRTLGLVWTIMEKFEISDISEADLSAKEALLKWCQRKTKDDEYSSKGVNITNFSTSWSNGLAFCALIHAHKPGLIPWETLKAENASVNLELAFKTASDLGIASLLDPEDLLDNPKPEDKSIMSQVAQYFKFFSLGNKSEAAAQKLKAMAKFSLDMQAKMEEYLKDISPLANWISEATSFVKKIDCKNTLEDTEAANVLFIDHRDKSKPPKHEEFLRLQSLFNVLQLQLKSCNRPPWVAPQGLSMNDLDEAWMLLAKTEQEKVFEINKSRKLQLQIKTQLDLFKRKKEGFEEWIAKKIEYLNQREEIASMTAAGTLLKLFESFENVRGFVVVFF